MKKYSSKMKNLDRTEHTKEIFEEIEKLTKQDMRIGQIFECIRTQCKQEDLFNMENDKLLEEIKKFSEG